MLRTINRSLRRPAGRPISRVATRLGRTPGDLGRRDDQAGFTLIELLVVMIVIGILAAIAIPVFNSQRQKGQDTAAKADVSTLGKELASYFVDGATAPVITLSGTPGRYQVNGKDAGRASANVTLVDTKGAPVSSLTLTPSTGQVVDQGHWCVAVSNTAGSAKTFKFSAQAGMQAGTCTSNDAP